VLALKVWWYGAVMRLASTTSHVAWLLSNHYDLVAQRAATRRSFARQDQEWRR
jgi:hypothetical protein